MVGFHLFSFLEIDRQLDLDPGVEPPLASHSTFFGAAVKPLSVLCGPFPLLQRVSRGYIA